MNKYEVQMHTLCDGWTNTWQIIDENGKSEPEIFDTEEQAAAALAEFLQDVQDEIDAGQREPDEAYGLDEFRIAKISQPKMGV